LPPDAVERLAPWQARELRDVRVVPPAHLQVTLAFIGSTPVVRFRGVADALAAAADGRERPVLTVSRYRETRSVAMLVLDDLEARATQLAQDLHGRLERLGVYEPERRAWLPHLTVARFRRQPRLRPPLPDLGDVVPSDAAVYLSRLRPGGAQYEILESVALGG